MPGAGRSIRTKTIKDIWVDVLAFPAFFSLFLVVTFVGDPEPDRPAWYAWAVRGGLALFLWLLGWGIATASFRELRRRDCWLPPGAARHPRPAAAA